MRLFLLVVLSISAMATDFPLTAHVTGVTTQRGAKFSAINSEGEWAYGRMKPTTEIKLRVNDVAYTVVRRCNVAVGQELPAHADSKHMYLLMPNGKVCKASIVSVRELTSQP